MQYFQLSVLHSGVWRIKWLWSISIMSCALCIWPSLFFLPAGLVHLITLPKTHREQGYQASRNDILEWHYLPHETLNVSLKQKQVTNKKNLNCVASISYPCFKIGVGHIDFNMLKWTKPLHLCQHLVICCSRIQSNSSWQIVFLIYFTYTCSDIHIISCCDALTPDSGWFIQMIHANLHSYHARIDRASIQCSGLWPKQANIDTKHG